jgi:hypothetical protein
MSIIQSCARVQSFGGIGLVEEIKQSGKHNENQKTGFRTSGTASQPVRAVNAYVEQVSNERFAIIAGVNRIYATCWR